jgi:hypothetical protein
MTNTIETLSAEIKGKSEVRIIRLDGKKYRCTRSWWFGTEEFEAWELTNRFTMDRGYDHSTLTFDDAGPGEVWGTVTSLRLPEWIDGLPVGEARFEACKAYRKEKERKAARVLHFAFPELRGEFLPKDDFTNHFSHA